MMVAVKIIDSYFILTLLFILFFALGYANYIVEHKRSKELLQRLKNDEKKRDNKRY